MEYAIFVSTLIVSAVAAGTDESVSLLQARATMLQDDDVAKLAPQDRSGWPWDDDVSGNDTTPTTAAESNTTTATTTAAVAASDIETGLGGATDAQAAQHESVTAANVEAMQSQADALKSQMEAMSAAIAAMNNQAASSAMHANIDQANGFATYAAAAVGAALSNTNALLDSGVTWPLEKVIRKNGMFRGVTLGVDAKGVALSEVVKFKKSIGQLNEASLSNKIMLIPDVQTAEASVESTSSAQLETANGVMDRFGASAFTSQALSVGLGVGASSGVHSFGLGVSMGFSGTSGTGTMQESQSNSQLSTNSKTYAKSRYLTEPKAIISVDKVMLEPTPEFVAAASEVQAGYSTIDELLATFGTHVCPIATLGGWWRLTAHVQRSSVGSSFEMSRIATHAIDRAYTASHGMAAQYEGAFLGISAKGEAASSSSHASHTSQESANAVTKADVRASDTSVMDVSQEWKGGVSGVTPGEWRHSLLSNSNWKVLDRFVDSCIGNWRFLPDSYATLKGQMCNKWRSTFLKEVFASLDIIGHGLQNISIPADTKECDNMQAFRKKVMDIATTSKAAVRTCIASVGMHWDATSSTCKENECTCRGRPGAVGAACPAHDTEECTAEQKAQFFAAPTGGCSQSVGHGGIGMQAGKCREMGGEIRSGNPAADDWTTCYFEWCTEGTIAPAPKDSCISKVGYGSIDATGSQCRKMSGAFNGNPGAQQWIDCYFDWCTDMDKGYAASTAGACSDKIGYGHIRTTGKTCRNMGGAMNGNPSDTTWTDCHLDWCSRS